jgi:tetratricopeptide (TPR) repeat protein
MCYTEIAAAYLKFGNKPRSLEILAEAVKSADSIKKPDEKARQLAWTARLLAEAGDTAGAASQFSRARLLAGASEKPSDTIDALYRVACEYAGQNSIKCSEVLAELHTLVAGTESEVDMASELINIAEIYYDIGQDSEAEAALGEAFRIAAGNRDPWFKTERLTEIALTYADAGHPGKADEILPLAYSSLSAIEEVSRFHFLLRIADIYLTLDRKSVAKEVLSGLVNIVKLEETAFSGPAALLR